MQSGFASEPKRTTTRRVSSERMAWSTCQAEGRWVRKIEPMMYFVLSFEFRQYSKGLVDERSQS
jgi:hypothetical protein